MRLKLKSLEQVKQGNWIRKEWSDGAITFSDGSHINTSMVINFGREIEVERCNTIGDVYKYVSNDHCYYRESWFEPEVDPAIDKLFEELLEDL